MAHKNHKNAQIVHTTPAVLREERDGERKGNITRTRKKTAADVRERERESKGSFGNESVKSWAIEFLID